MKSPKGSANWPKRTIQNMLVNEKVYWKCVAKKNLSGEFPNNKQKINRGKIEQFLAEEAHSPIIAKEVFEQVQEELHRRSNIKIVDGKRIRKDTPYSTKNIIS